MVRGGLTWGGVPARGVYLVGVCTWSRGVYLVPGVCTWSRGCVPGPGGCVPGPRGVYLPTCLGDVPAQCTWGVYLTPGGVYLPGGVTWSQGWAQGGVPAQGVYLTPGDVPVPRGVYLVPGGVYLPGVPAQVPPYPPPPVNRMTDRQV